MLCTQCKHNYVIDNKQWFSGLNETFEWFSNTVASTNITFQLISYLQYLSHMDLNLGCPPISQSLIVTFPLEIFLILKPTVGIMSSLKFPEAITFTKVVFPACCSPTSVSSISSFQKRDLNHSSTLLIIANILVL